MKKPLLSLLFVVLVACSLVLVNIVQLSGAQASGTNVSGIIYANTTWTLASSPYNLVGPVAVNTGVMLTIEAGTVVNLNGNYITVNGTFVAKGTSTTNIQFNGAGQSFGKIDLTALSNGWNDQTGSGSIIQYVTGSSTQISLESPAKIDHSTLAGDVLMSNVVQGSCGVISNNTITVSYGDGIICSGNASVLNNTV
ncbi:MAG TPA: hypothetical protein VLU95_01055, partial [Candidatus Acidoferrum sp.]|nr:hypothetical protein [Candidatus Acidoferrum sp.]